MPAGPGTNLNECSGLYMAGNDAADIPVGGK